MSDMLMPMTRAGDTPRLDRAPIIHREQAWCALPGEAAKRRVTASRWSGCAPDGREELSQIADDRHVLGIALRPMHATIYAGPTLLHDGRMPQGMVSVNAPGQPLRGIFRGNFDSLHLHVPNTLLDTCALSSTDGSARLCAAAPIVDPVIERLAQALLRAEDIGGAFGQSYADCVSLAIIARLLGGQEAAASARSSSVGGLAKWRLKRATDYMAAHLSEPIRLADIAGAAGLTRMHFAAQFRAATGLRPHEYLLRQRIDKARDLLATSQLPLVEVAFEVGFKTQAHFNTVFAKFTGETPNAWRRQQTATPSRDG